MIENVVNAHMNTCNYTADKVEAGMKRHLQINEQLNKLQAGIDPPPIVSKFYAWGFIRGGGSFEDRMVGVSREGGS